MERIIIRRFILGGKGNVGSLHCIVVEIDATERLLDAAQRSGSFARLQLAFPHLNHASPYASTPSGPEHRAPDCAQSSAARSRHLSSAGGNSGTPHAHARNIRLRKSPYGSDQAQCRACPAERARSCDSGIPGKTGSGAPSFPDACRGCGCATCSDAVARLSLCQPY